MVFVPLRSLLPYGKRVITSPAAVHRRLSRCIEKDDDASGYGMALYAMQWAPCTGIIWLVHTHRSRASWQEEESPDILYHQEWPRSRSTSGLIIGTFQSSVTQEHDNQTLLYDGAPSGVEREPSF